MVDRFHIERMANGVIKQMRKRFRKELPEKERLKLKDERFLLLKRQHDLRPEQFERLSANWWTKGSSTSRLQQVRVDLTISLRVPAHPCRLPFDGDQRPCSWGSLRYAAKLFSA